MQKYSERVNICPFIEMKSFNKNMWAGPMLSASAGSDHHRRERQEPTEERKEKHVCTRLFA